MDAVPEKRKKRRRGGEKKRGERRGEEKGNAALWLIPCHPHGGPCRGPAVLQRKRKRKKERGVRGTGRSSFSPNLF